MHLAQNGMSRHIVGFDVRQHILYINIYIYIYRYRYIDQWVNHAQKYIFLRVTVKYDKLIALIIHHIGLFTKRSLHIIHWINICCAKT